MKERSGYKVQTAKLVVTKNAIELAKVVTIIYFLSTAYPRNTLNNKHPYTTGIREWKPIK
jgi:hypothetical protein